MIKRTTFYISIAFMMFVLEIGTVGALECDNISIKQALVQLLIFGAILYASLDKGGVFDDNM